MTTKQSPVSGLMASAMVAVALVWAGGAAFNFSEQEHYAFVLGFRLPWLLPVLLDGLSIALAIVATAASLDGRAAIIPRLGTLAAVSASSWVSGHAAYTRVFGLDQVAVLIGVGVPLFSLLAFEVELNEIRRVVQKRRGRLSPVPIPMPRLVMWIAQPPWRTYSAWRRAALEQCERELVIVQGQAVEATVTQAMGRAVEPTPKPAPVKSTPVRVAITDRGERLAEMLRRHPEITTVSAFRTAARAADIPCPNGAARELFDTARAKVEAEQ